MPDVVVQRVPDLANGLREGCLRHRDAVPHRVEQLLLRDPDRTRSTVAGASPATSCTRMASTSWGELPPGDRPRVVALSRGPVRSEATPFEKTRVLA